MVSNVIDIRTRRKVVLPPLQVDTQAGVISGLGQGRQQRIDESLRRINTLLAELKRSEYEVAIGTTNPRTKHAVSCICDVCQAATQQVSVEDRKRPDQ